MCRPVEVNEALRVTSAIAEPDAEATAASARYERFTRSWLAPCECLVD